MNKFYQAKIQECDAEIKLQYQMLSEKYGLPVGRLRAIKGDLEVMFADELAEKFSPAPEMPAEEPKEEKK